MRLEKPKASPFFGLAVCLHTSSLPVANKAKALPSAYFGGPRAVFRPPCCLALHKTGESATRSPSHCVLVAHLVFAVGEKGEGVVERLGPDVDGRVEVCRDDALKVPLLQL